MKKLQRTMNSERCEETPSQGRWDLELERRRSSFILRNRFRRLAGDKRLGVLWIVLEPLIMSLVYLFVFTVLRSSISTESLFIGISLWGLATVSVISGIDCISDFSGGLKCERVRTSVLVRPMVQFRIIDSACRTIGVALILFLIFDVNFMGVSSLVIIGMVLGILLEGLALNLSKMGNAVPDLKVLTRHFMRLMFFAGPVLYPLTFASGIHYQINLFNPFTYFVETVREFAKLESSYSELDPVMASSILGVVILLSIRGYMRIERYRWELSSWS